MGCMGSKGGDGDEKVKDDTPSVGQIVELATHSLHTPHPPQQFELLCLVGEGSFAKIFQVRQRSTGRIYAMKCLRKQRTVTSKLVKHTQTEKAILINLRHPFLVTLHYAFQSDEKLYLVMDFINGGDLRYHLRSRPARHFDEATTRFYAAEVISALSFLHSNNILYRDLKPANILLDSQGHIRLIDFGLSKRLHSPDDLTYTFCGTPQYISPELVERKGFGLAMDVWSLGILIWELLTGNTPFFHTNVRVLYSKIIEGKLLFPSRISKEADHLLRHLLVRDPAERLEFFATIKHHPFFSPISWEMLERKEIPPPINPGAKDEMDTSCIDPVFSEIPAVDSAAPNRLENVIDAPRIEGGAVAAAPVDERPDAASASKSSNSLGLHDSDPFHEFTYVNSDEESCLRDRRQWRSFAEGHIDDATPAAAATIAATATEPADGKAHKSSTSTEDSEHEQEIQVTAQTHAPDLHEEGDAEDDGEDMDDSGSETDDQTTE